MRDLLLPMFGNVFQKELIDEIEDKAVLKNLKAGTTLIDYGKYIKSIPLVLNGAIKIVREDEKGHELFLYYLNGGDTCAMSLTCCMNHKKSEIKAIAETEAQMVMIPLEYMDEWMKYASWRQFVFRSYNARFEEMLSALDAVAFMNLDERLLNYLLDVKTNTGTFEIFKTHQEIATDLGTSRVVISRLLKRLAEEDQIELHRNRIEIL
ncbi:Crp/Fnr family transcriptional regulator [Reichenbachiella agarivorans]|uniref:Crp/Fnr family transcriptional regulator n=1 Tax=Reichenbachiella agarivorans TaxID=2979464 RepID=A0ABY6CJB9_9BACT|nr:Crp/Fnr family transcriptional regulator [Reichenbachiella agarivorans]UXP30620.1 Crp/Fnr family transcriptional regulator [Reichenbachiella agarivorans]